MGKEILDAFTVDNVEATKTILSVLSLENPYMARYMLYHAKIMSLWF